MPCSSCGSSGSGRGRGRGRGRGMVLGIRGCGSFYFFKRRRVKSGR